MCKLKLMYSCSFYFSCSFFALTSTPFSSPTSFLMISPWIIIPLPLYHLKFTLPPPPHLVAIFLIPSLPTPHSTLIPGQCSLYRAYPCTLPLPSFSRGCLLLPHDRHVPFIRPQSDPPYTLPPSSFSNLLDSYYIHYVYILLPSKLTLRIPYPNFYFFAFFFPFSYYRIWTFNSRFQGNFLTT